MFDVNQMWIYSHNHIRINGFLRIKEGGSEGHRQAR